MNSHHVFFCFGLGYWMLLQVVLQNQITGNDCHIIQTIFSKALCLFNFDLIYQPPFSRFWALEQEHTKPFTSICIRYIMYVHNYIHYIYRRSHRLIDLLTCCIILWTKWEVKITAKPIARSPRLHQRHRVTR